MCCCCCCCCWCWCCYCRCWQWSWRQCRRSCWIFRQNLVSLVVVDVTMLPLRLSLSLGLSCGFCWCLFSFLSLPLLLMGSFVCCQHRSALCFCRNCSRGYTSWCCSCCRRCFRRRCVAVVAVCRRCCRWCDSFQCRPCCRNLRVALHMTIPLRPIYWRLQSVRLRDRRWLISPWSWGNTCNSALAWYHDFAPRIRRDKYYKNCIDLCSRVMDNVSLFDAFYQ